MLKKSLAVSTFIAFIILSAVLQSTSPSTIHPLGILIVFFLLYVLVLGLVTYALIIINRVIVKISVQFSKNIAYMTWSKAYYFASVLALAPVMYVGMRSIGKTGVYEILLILLFEIVACFYIAKRR